MSMTARQFIALHLYLCKGETERSIARVLGIKPSTAHTLIVRGKRWIVAEAGDPETASKSPLIRGLLHPTPSVSTTGHAGNAVSRREELLDRLELHMEQRARELADIEECMSCNSVRPTQRNGVGRGGVSIGPSGTSWPPEKWQDTDGRICVLPCDDQ